MVPVSQRDIIAEMKRRGDGMSIAAAMEIERLLEKNRELNRRANIAEGPAKSEVDRLTAESESWRKSWKLEFGRLLAAHKELQIIFNMTREIIPDNWSGCHSVMDWGFGGRHGDGFVYANMFIPGGGADTIRVVDRVRETIDLLRGRTP